MFLPVLPEHQHLSVDDRIFVLKATIIGPRRIFLGTWHGPYKEQQHKELEERARQLIRDIKRYT